MYLIYLVNRILPYTSYIRKFLKEMIGQSGKRGDQIYGRRGSIWIKLPLVSLLLVVLVLLVHLLPTFTFTFYQMLHLAPIFTFTFSGDQIVGG